MNLKEFIDYRKSCPMCDGPMSTLFISYKRQMVRYENNRLLFVMAMNPLASWRNVYNVGYSFDLTNNLFSVEFYTKAGKHYYEEVPQFLRERFLAFHKNVGGQNGFKFIRVCGNNGCASYQYMSAKLDLSLKTSSVGNLEIMTEIAELVQPLGEKSYRVYSLKNSLIANKTDLYFWKSDTEKVGSTMFGIPAMAETTHLRLPLIPFVSKNETTKRLNNLIIFT